MKTLPATTPQAAKLYLSPVAVWQMLLARLLAEVFCKIFLYDLGYFSLSVTFVHAANLLFLFEI